jgi:hypothetical protein
MRVNVTVALRTHSSGIGRNGIVPSVADSGLRHHGLSELHDGRGRTAENDRRVSGPTGRTPLLIVLRRELA